MKRSEWIVSRGIHASNDARLSVIFYISRIGEILDVSVILTMVWATGNCGKKKVALIVNECDTQQ